MPSTRSAIPEGARWRWFGPTLRLDGPADALLLPETPDRALLRRRARATVAKLGRARGAGGMSPPPVDDGEDRPGLIVSDGKRRWNARAVPTRTGETLLVFDGELPPRDRTLRVVQGVDAPRAAPDPRSTICFTPGTLIDTPRGPCPVEGLYPGDLVRTRDDGDRPILWVGLRHVSGARMFAFPELRPIRIRAGALGTALPQPDLVVSPAHRVLVRGPKCRALWGEDEVLVRARDLVDDRAVLVDHGATETVYIHLLLERHQVLCANGVPAESFHPGEADLAHLNAADLEDLLEIAPGIDRDPLAYGPAARRCLSRAEWAILGHEAPRRFLDA